MRAWTQRRFGLPEVLALEEIDRPSIADDQMLIRVRATSVNASDWHGMRGRPLFGRLSMGFRTPKQAIPGGDVAGEIEAVGRDVADLVVGDEVMGVRSGAFAEYVAGRPRNFVRKPPNLSFAEAAAIPVAASTALQALRDHGRLQAGQEVLILGAGGGVGSFAVQLALVLGGRVTATTRPESVEAIRALGAAQVPGHERGALRGLGRRFDVIADVGGYASLRELAPLLAPGGTIVMV